MVVIPCESDPIRAHFSTRVHRDPSTVDFQRISRAMVFALTSTTFASSAPTRASARATRTRRSSIILRADAEDATEAATEATTEDDAESDAETTPKSESEDTGELGIKKGLAGAFIKPGDKEVSAEKFRAYQAEIAAKKAAAQKRQEGKVKKGPFGLW